MDSFITVEEMRDKLLSAVGPVGEETMMLEGGVGRRLAEPIEATEDNPPFDNSSRDGFALRFEDVGGEGNSRFEVVDTAAAGDAAETEIGHGEAARILTGAPVPDGADTVVMQEHVQVIDDGDVIEVNQAPEKRGEWVRHAGSYLRAGETVLKPGDRIRAPEVGLLANLGHASVTVYRRPTVAVITAGDELVDVDEIPGSDEIVDSNRYQLGALLEEVGVDVVRIPRASDTVVEVRTAFEQAVSAADLVVSVGGVSVGDRDVVRTVMDELTGGLDAFRVRMKPGKPLAFGVAQNDAATPMIGLPGNPNSVFVCFQQFARPMLGKMAGADPEHLGLNSLTATLETPTESTPHRREYQAGVVRPPSASGSSEADDGRPVFKPQATQSSGDPSLFCRQNAFGIVPENVHQMDAGDPITVELLTD